MESVLKETRERMQKSLDAFEANVATIRTGRANPAILNRITVSYYGISTPLNQLASISTPDPRTLLVTPFDKGAIQNIEKAIQEGGLGFNPNNQGDVIYIAVPPLNDERRRELVRRILAQAEGVAETVASGERRRQRQNAKARRNATANAPMPDRLECPLPHDSLLGAFRGFIKKPCTISMTTPTLIAESARLKAGQ